MVEGVIVAAGYSSRANGWKLAFKLGGTTVIERCVMGMAPYCSTVWVVGGNHFDLLQELLPAQKYPAVQLIYNGHYREGMFTSVLAGLRQVRAGRFFFIPGDYPLVSRKVYERLLQNEGEIVIPAYQGRAGHPVLFETKAVQDLLRFPERYAYLRQFIASRHPHLFEVDDPGILMDIDTPEDYQRAVRYFALLP